MSAPIQASASVHVVPASNWVRSSTRMPAKQPGDTGVTSILDSFGEWTCRLRKAGEGDKRRCGSLGLAFCEWRYRLPNSTLSDRCRNASAAQPGPAGE